MAASGFADATQDDEFESDVDDGDVVDDGEVVVGDAWTDDADPSEGDY